MRSTSTGGWKLRCTLRGPVATSEPTVEISADGRDKPVVRNLPEVKPRIPLLGVISSDIPLQGASTSSKPTEGEGQGHLVSRVGGLRLAKKSLVWMGQTETKKGKSKGKRHRNWGHSATRKCRHAQAGRNPDQNP
jgi:hypothetical protein